MRKKMRVLTIVLAASFMCSSIVGCSTQKKSDGNTPSSSSEPVAPKDLKITWWSRNFSNGELTTMADAACFKELTKKTGLTISFQHPAAGTNEAEALNLLIASNQLPDVIFADWTKMQGGISRYIASKSIIPLNTYIDKYATNYKKTIEKDSEVKKQVQLDDGTYPAMYTINEYTTASSGFVMRKDWLDKLKLKAPTTIDEWYTTLKAIKDGDPNGNGKKDEIPWSENKDAGAWRNLAGAWGFKDDNDFSLDPATGKITYGPLNSQYKDFITTIAKWYKEGLIDPDYAVQDKKAWEAKITGNIAGAAWMAVGGGIGTYTASARPKNPSFELTAVPNPKGTNGKSYATQNLKSKTGNYSFTITNACKYPAEIVKAMDYLFTDEGSILFNWGIEGETYTVQNGTRQFTDKILKNPEGKSAVTALMKYTYPTYGSTPKRMMFDAYSSANLLLPEQKLSHETWSKADSGLYLPPVALTTEESSTIASIMTDISTYKGEMELKFVIGQEPLSKVDEFVSKIKQMRLQEAADIYQKAYDRYQKRK